MDIDTTVEENSLPFELDERLRQDCLVMGEFDLSVVLLMNNSLVPWFILVPQVKATEMYQLSLEDQHILNQEIYALSKFLKDDMQVDKINVASIGNVVRQLHVHVIGRYFDDYCWPEPVWGRSEKKPYDDGKLQNISQQLLEFLTERLD